jgi:Uma2 family endonuclease
MLSDRPRIVCPSDLRIRVSSGGLFTYSDVIVIRGEPQYADDRDDTVLNPTLIVEVLSKSTEADDRGFKFAEYRQLESLREYVLISQNEPRVEKFQNQLNGAWMLSEYVGFDAVCELPSIDTRIPLSKIYRKVKFSDGVAAINLESETHAPAETPRRVD